MQWSDFDGSIWNFEEQEHVDEFCGHCKFDIKIAWSSSAENFIFSGFIADYLRHAFNIAPKNCLVFAGSVTLRAASWEITFGKFIQEYISRQIVLIVFFRGNRHSSSSTNNTKSKSSTCHEIASNQNISSL